MCIIVRIIAPRENLSPRMSSHCVICFFFAQNASLLLFLLIWCAPFGWVKTPHKITGQSNEPLVYPYLYKCRHRETIQNNWNIPQYDPSISHHRLQVGFQCSFSKLVYQFGFNPSIGGSSSSLSGHTMKGRFFLLLCAQQEEEESFFFLLFGV